MLFLSARYSKITRSSKHPNKPRNKKALFYCLKVYYTLALWKASEYHLVPCVDTGEGCVRVCVCVCVWKFLPNNCPDVLPAQGDSILTLPTWIWCFGSQYKDFSAAAAAAAKSLQSCPTLWDPIDGSPWGSPVPGILQARTLEWVAISFSNAWKWKVKVKSLSRVQLFTIPWTAAHQAPPSMGFSRQENWSGVPLPSPDFNARKEKYANEKSNDC